MFDDLRDPQPPDSEPGDDLPSDDELLADLSGPTPVEDPFGLDETVADDPLFSDELLFGDEPLFGEEPPEPPRAARVKRDMPLFGMTAQQRAVLSIFLFLDVSALGCVLLLAAGAISIP